MIKLYFIFVEGYAHFICNFLYYIWGRAPGAGDNIRTGTNFFFGYVMKQILHLKLK